MEYISTSQAAKKWNISATRVALLAKNGRIQGATLVGKSWMIPFNAQKPCDARMKNNTASSLKDDYRFPIYTFQNIRDINILNYTQQLLYQAQLSLAKCEFNEAFNLAVEILNNNQDILISIGALYTACYASLHLRQFETLKYFVNQMRKVFENDFPHKEELKFVLYDVEVLVSGNESYSTLDIDPQYSYHESTLPYIYASLVYQLLTKMTYGYTPSDLNQVEIICQDLWHRGYLMAAQYIHVYLSIIYARTFNDPRAQYHADAAIEIAEQSGFIMHLVEYYSLNNQYFDKAMLNVKPTKLQKLVELYESAGRAILDFMEDEYEDNSLPQLSKNDYPYIRAAASGKTNKEIAAMLNVAESTVAKHLSDLYVKTGAHSKKELATMFATLISKYDLAE